jgi:hypothetical protein
MFISFEIDLPAPDLPAVLIAIIDGEGYDPTDRLPSGELAADVVYEWTLDPRRDLDELLDAHGFLSRWPEGPRVEIGVTRAARMLDITPGALAHQIKVGHAKARRIDNGYLLTVPELARLTKNKPRAGRPRTVIGGRLKGK